MQGRRYSFGPYLLDAGRDTLLRDGEALAMGRPALLLLEALVRAQGETVTKAELMDAAWPQRVVEESNLSVQVAALRKLLGATPQGNDWIVTVARVGYRFTGRVATVQPGEQPAGDPLSASEAGPRVAVLPFANLSGEPQQQYFSDGITEDIITALSRFRWFFVLGRSSSFAFRDRQDAVQEIARTLGVRYVLEGSVRRAGHHTRITVQLVDTHTASQIWAERFDFDMADMLAVQGAIAQRVAGAIEPELLKSETARAFARPPGGSPSAWDLVYRGAWLFHQITPQGHHEARRLLRDACQLDSEFAPAHIWLARVAAGIVAYGWSDDADADLREGIDAALRAIHLDEKNPYAHYGLAITSVIASQNAQALRAAERAEELNPSFALAHLVLGMARLYAGDAADAVAPLEHGLQINPFGFQGRPPVGPNFQSPFRAFEAAPRLAA